MKLSAWLRCDVRDHNKRNGGKYHSHSNRAGMWSWYLLTEKHINIVLATIFPCLWGPADLHISNSSSPIPVLPPPALTEFLMQIIFTFDPLEGSASLKSESVISPFLTTNFPYKNCEFARFWFQCKCLHLTPPGVFFCFGSFLEDSSA